MMATRCDPLRPSPRHALTQKLGQARFVPGLHDLRFEVAAADPAQVADLIATEGIVANAIGSCSTTFGAGLLALDYVGTLLSDALVESVRVGVARGADAASAEVAVRPESKTGVGVDTAIEPFPIHAVIAHSVVDHTVDGAPPVPVSPGPWLAYWVGLAVVVGMTVALAGWSLMQRRRRLRASAFGPERPDPGSP
jgi:hypothetical protein